MTQARIYTFHVTDFGKRLRTTREERGLTQRDLARLAKVAEMLVSRYERGVGYPAMETTIALANALEASLDYLVLGKNGQKERDPVGIRHLLLLEKMREVDRELGHKEIDAIIGFLDAYLAKKRIRQLVSA